jgi:hypothetical protein|nr:MAG TPA: hypothetical protein [Caudoviricetes sp.]DAZ27026.1 MAG TPA: hypothetical protein [Caudoviricetes sp.]
MAQIIAPNKDYNGESASVTFVKGVGETSDAYLIEWFKEHGYTVVDSKPPEVPSVAPEENPAADVETEEQAEETQEKPKRTRSSRAKAADAE